MQGAAAEMPPPLPRADLLGLPICGEDPSVIGHRYSLAQCFAKIAALDDEVMNEHVRPAPTLSFAAGFAFARGHRMANVPNIDRPWVFHGEEWSMLVHLWSAGYDTYAPVELPIFHFYPHELARAPPSRRAPDFRGFAHHPHHDDAYKHAVEESKHTVRLNTVSGITSTHPTAVKLLNAGTYDIFARVAKEVAPSSATARQALRLASILSSGEVGAVVNRQSACRRGSESCTFEAQGALSAAELARRKKDVVPAAVTPQSKPPHYAIHTPHHFDTCMVDGTCPTGTLLPPLGMELPPLRSGRARRPLTLMADVWGIDFGYALSGDPGAITHAGAFALNFCVLHAAGVVASQLYGAACPNGNGVDVEKLLLHSEWPTYIRDALLEQRGAEKRREQRAAAAIRSDYLKGLLESAKLSRERGRAGPEE